MEAGQKGMEPRVSYERFGARLNVKDALAVVFLVCYIWSVNKIKLLYTLSASVLAKL